MFDQRNNTQSWLNISIDAALGCRANVFHIIRHAGKKSERQGNIIAIHPQAAPTVCRLVNLNKRRLQSQKMQSLFHYIFYKKYL